MNKLKVALVVVILLLGFLLRWHNYDTQPPRGATSDEYSYSFLGLSLLTKGIPETWSNVSGYENRYHLTIRGIYFPMVYPYFDHPPLYGVLVGGWALLNGQRTFEQIDIATIRMIPVLLSVISSLLVFLLGNKLYGYKVGIWALLIYSSVTIFAINQRVVFAENLWTPLLLGSLYLYIKIKKQTIQKSILLGILAGLAFWAKELGIAVFIILFALQLIDKVKYKYLLTFLGVSCLFFLGYIFYGYYYSWETFTTIVATQSDRKLGHETLHMLFFKPAIVNRMYSDGWYYLGFITMLFSLTNTKKYLYIALPSFLYLLLMLCMLNNYSEEMGWYVIPLFPFMALSIATFWHESREKKNGFIFLLVLFVGLPLLSTLYKITFGLTAFQFRIISILLFGPLLTAYIFHKEKLFGILSSFYFYLFIFLTVVTTYTYIHPL